MTARKALALLLPVLLVATAGPAVSSEAASGKRAVVEHRIIGKTVKGRGIVAWRVGQPSARRKVVVFAAMHGNETGPSRILKSLLNGKRIRNVDMWLVPQYNRDGVIRHTRQNAHGVDLNRNFTRNWQRQGGSTNSGPRPASEPETKAVMAFLRKIRPAYVVSFHQPLRGVGRAGSKGASFVRKLSRGLRLPVKSFNCSGRCHGTMTEWYNAYFPGVAVTVEYGRGVSRKQATRTGPTGLLRAVGARR